MAEYPAEWRKLFAHELGAEVDSTPAIDPVTGERQKTIADLINEDLVQGSLPEVVASTTPVQSPLPVTASTNQLAGQPQPSAWLSGEIQANEVESKESYRNQALGQPQPSAWSATTNRPVLYRRSGERAGRLAAMDGRSLAAEFPNVPESLKRLVSTPPINFQKAQSSKGGKARMASADRQKLSRLGVEARRKKRESC